MRCSPLHPVGRSPQSIRTRWDLRKPQASVFALGRQGALIREPQRKLDLTVSSLGGGNRTRAADPGRCVGQSELRMIESVEKLRSELKLPRLAKAEFP